jgi:SAM-dependent methyltransferase
MPADPAAGDAQVAVNVRVWSRVNFVRQYASRDLRPPEAVLLERYREELGGGVLELGCGAGRISGHLAQIARELRAVDVSPAMIAYSSKTYPGAIFELRDLRDLSVYEDASYDAVVAGFSVLDVLDDTERRHVLTAIARILVPGGLLIMSSHNLAHAPRIRSPLQLRGAGPTHAAARLLFAPLRLRNHRRLAPLERRETDYAVLNDEAHQFRLLHYYIDRDAQERQLAETGFELLECLDGAGGVVRPGEQALEHAELHYAARRRANEPILYAVPL